MAFSFPLTMPASPAPRRSVFGAEFNNITSLSINKTRQVIRRPGDLIVYEFDLPSMLRAQAAAWSAFGMGLQGSFGTFRAGDPDAKTARGVATGAWQVKGATQTGDELIIDGADISTTGVFRAGDWLQIDNRLRMVYADVNSDGVGETTVTISPPIGAGEAPADNAAVTYINPTGIFRLIEDRLDWSADNLSRYGISFRAIEAVNT